MIFVSRRSLLLIGILIESIVLMWVVITGEQGVQSLQKKHADNRFIEIALVQKKEEIQELQRQVTEWKTSLFLHEQYAREKLHMGKKDEIIFFYDPTTQEATS